jgi:hypothetical protein
VKANMRPKKLKKLRELEAHERCFKNKGEQQYFTSSFVHFAGSIYTFEPGSY